MYISLLNRLSYLFNYYFKYFVPLNTLLCFIKNQLPNERINRYEIYSFRFKDRHIYISVLLETNTNSEVFSGKLFYQKKYSKFIGHLTSVKVVDQLIRDQWDALGFFVEFNHIESVWLIKLPLINTYKLLTIFREFIIDLSKPNPINHIHISPDFEFQLIAGDEPLICDEGIVGNLVSFNHLLKLLTEKLENVKISDEVYINEEYSSVNEASILITITDSNFKPSYNANI